MEDNINIESSNIHSKWLENIYNQLMKIQEMELLALEGCSSLAEYLEIPLEMVNVILPEIQYKNLKFLVHELNSLIDNLSPILKDDVKNYRKKLESIINNIDIRHLFFKDIRDQGQIIEIRILPFFKKTLNFILLIKSDLIRHKKVMPILYYEEETKKW